MSLIVESGTGLADSESYLSVAEALGYHAARGNDPWATITTTQQEQALRRATDYMIQVYRQRWKGVRLNAVQALDWPRFGVYLEPVMVGIVSDYPYLVPSNIVPSEIKKACAELALLAAAGNLLDNTTQKVISETVGTIATEYDRYSPQQTQYRAVDALLNVYFNSQSGIEHKIVR